MCNPLKPFKHHNLKYHQKVFITSTKNLNMLYKISLNSKNKYPNRINKKSTLILDCMDYKDYWTPKYILEMRVKNFLQRIQYLAWI